MDRVDRADAAFDIVLRGYDKRQVDERLRFLESELAAAGGSLRPDGRADESQHYGQEGDEQCPAGASHQPPGTGHRLPCLAANRPLLP